MARDHETVRGLYRKLLALYPRAFREQLGESMEQTFNDLYTEQRQRAKGHIGFVVGIFFETAVGALQERVFAVREHHTMKAIGAHLTGPAMLGFFAILPLVIIELVSVIARQGSFSLRNAVDSAAIFGVLWFGIASIILILMPIVRNTRAEGGVADQPAPAAERTSLLASPLPAALIGLVLLLPFVTIISLLILGIEPSFGPLEPLLNNPDPGQPDVLGSLIVVGAFALAVLGCIIVRAPIVRTMRAGGSMFAHPANLLLAAAILLVITTVVGGIIADQYPCWIGAPNCD